MKVKGKIWLEAGGNHLFGRGRANLLRAIQEEGSIQAAARRMNISYRHAWAMLNASEKRWGRKLVETRRGGRDGGGARVTEPAQKLNALFRRFDAQLNDLIRRHQRELEDADI